ncbi:MAG: MCP four helix bundle domain-containing protein, partial [Gammaproteobacteria bacterium]
MKPSNFRLGAKLGAAFLVVVALTAGVGILSVTQLARINADTEEIAGNWLPSIEALANLRNGLNEFRRSESLHVLAPGDEEMALQEKRMADLKKDIASTLATFQALIGSPEERRLHDDFARNLDAYYASNRKLIELSGGEAKLAETKRYFREDSHVALNETVKSIAALIDRNVKGGDAAHEAAKATYMQARVWVIGIVAAATLIAILLAIALTRLVTRPMVRAVAAAERIAAGDLTVELSAQGKDETAQLLQALCAMKDSLGSLVAGVRQNAEGVATASTQIAQGNSDLSGRTEEQASALEETAASMEELGSTVSQNADNARQANHLALSASSVASRGGEVVGQVVSTMKDI